MADKVVAVHPDGRVIVVPGGLVRMASPIDENACCIPMWIQARKCVDHSLADGEWFQLVQVNGVLYARDGDGFVHTMPFYYEKDGGDGTRFYVDQRDGFTSCIEQTLTTGVVLKVGCFPCLACPDPPGTPKSFTVTWDVHYEPKARLIYVLDPVCGTGINVPCRVGGVIDLEFSSPIPPITCMCNSDVCTWHVLMKDAMSVNVKQYRVNRPIIGTPSWELFKTETLTCDLEVTANVFANDGTMIVAATVYIGEDSEIFGPENRANSVKLFTGVGGFAIDCFSFSIPNCFRRVQPKDYLRNGPYNPGGPEAIYWYGNGSSGTFGPPPGGLDFLVSPSLADPSFDFGFGGVEYILPICGGPNSVIRSELALSWGGAVNLSGSSSYCSFSPKYRLTLTGTAAHCQKGLGGAGSHKGENNLDTVQSDIIPNTDNVVDLIDTYSQYDETDPANATNCVVPNATGLGDNNNIRILNMDVPTIEGGDAPYAEIFTDAGGHLAWGGRASSIGPDICGWPLYVVFEFDATKGGNFPGGVNDDYIYSGGHLVATLDNSP